MASRCYGSRSCRGVWRGSWSTRRGFAEAALALSACALIRAIRFLPFHRWVSWGSPSPRALATASSSVLHEMSVGAPTKGEIAPRPGLFRARVGPRLRLPDPLERAGALQILARYLDESIPDIAGLALLGEPAVTLGLGVQAFGFRHAWSSPCKGSIGVDNPLARKKLRTPCRYS